MFLKQQTIIFEWLCVCVCVCVCARVCVCVRVKINNTSQYYWFAVFLIR